MTVGRSFASLPRLAWEDRVAEEEEHCAATESEEDGKDDKPAKAMNNKEHLPDQSEQDDCGAEDKTEEPECQQDKSAVFSDPHISLQGKSTRSRWRQVILRHRRWPRLQSLQRSCQ